MNGGIRYQDRNQRGLKDPVLDAIGPAEFNAGPIPHRIIGMNYLNDRGLVGGDVNYVPEFGDWLFIPHQNAKRRISPANKDGIPTIDETAQITAFSVGM